MARTTDYAQGETPGEAVSDGQLSVGDLCRMFEESEEATQTSRIEAERDRDYYDNKQLTAEELATLKKRGQPPVIINRIKSKIDFLVGLEKDQGVEPRALPRTPQHENDADAASQALRYVADTEDYDTKRSGAWRNLLIEGTTGISVSVEDGYDGVNIKLRRWAWDRLFHDPHSCELDFSDASYLGGVIWMDYDDALADYPDGQEALDTTMSSVAQTETYDDKPKFQLWADKKRKRVRICQIWLKRDEQWHFAEFTKGGILKAGPSPYKDDKGQSDCEMLLQSAYINRDNERYGVVRQFISPQDEINKRRSKSLHLLNTAQIVMEEGSLSNLNDIEAVRREAARPDGVIVVAPRGDGGIEKRFQFNTRTDLAEGQFKLMQEAKNEIDLMGPNATMQGDKTGGSASASGKAIIASQQGGMIEMGDLLDNLRHLDKRVFRAIWNRIRQFWTAEKWVRVTDDERNVKWIGMNVDPMQVQQAAQQNPEMAQKIAGVVSSVAELDCDIIIDEAPDSVTPALEQWQALVELAKSGVAIPPRTLIKAAPNLKNKDQLIEEMEQAQKAAQEQPNPEIAMMQQKLQLEQQTAVARIQMDREAAQAERELRQEQIATDYQTEMMKIAAKAESDRAALAAKQQADREKLAAEMHAERERGAIQISTERDKQAVALHGQREKLAAEDERDKRRVETERSVNTEKAKDPKGDSATKAIEGLTKALMAPTKIVRGKDGRAEMAQRVLGR